MKVCVLACSRSGTMYATEFFRKAYGLDVGHERPGPDGGLGWTMLAHRRKMPFESFGVVLHQVRHPQMVMSTFHTHFPALWRLFAEAVGGLSGGGLKQYMGYWCKYNERAQEVASFTYRVEDLYDGTETTQHIGELLGVTPKAVALGKDINTQAFRRTTITMDMLREADRELADKVLELSNRYGYVW